MTLPDEADEDHREGLVRRGRRQQNPLIRLVGRPISRARARSVNSNRYAKKSMVSRRRQCLVSGRIEVSSVIALRTLEIAAGGMLQALALTSEPSLVPVHKP